MGNNGSKKNQNQALPINTTFNFPSPLPPFPQGKSAFAGGVIDLGGGLKIRLISSFNKIWTTHDGGPSNLGATFFEPSPLPQGFFSLGHYCQPNNKPFFARILVGRDDSLAGDALKKPVDFTLVWTSEKSNIKRDTDGYIWSPTPPDGYRAVGHVVTTSSVKPSVDRVRCVRADLTEQSEKETWIWGLKDSIDENGFNIFSFRPTRRDITAAGVSVGTFVALPATNSPLPLLCLRNSASISAAMPDVSQISTLFRAYAPLIYFHPKEKFLPSSVNWYFSNGALLYNKSVESKPVPIDPNGTNLPQGGQNDGGFWLDLPIDGGAKEKVKHGDLQSCQVYLQIKPMIGGTFTDITIWIFFPFNGPATAKVGIIDIPFRKIGEHVGDWEHITLRISNFTGELWKVYFAQHSKGEWIDASSLEFEKGNKVVAYSSLNGHASYSKPGLVMQGGGEIGLKNETAKSGLVLDTGASSVEIATEYLREEAVTEPAWLNYFRQWGPKIEYQIAEEMEKVEKLLPGRLKEAFKQFMNRLPDEILGQEGPTGPKLKDSWNGDERS
ncbi:uncharacterized protein LOC101218337 [Cucumis sativus]|uniref:DUF946 domain-containing protein n=1 Tax=Cucumis sativus TaxID=3659 RepID=A0A0A0L9X8_CUCSA|nr:uncharacterized protein LOC101218337 [Cucumis sativus]KGN58638.1 hypothetical protein Csa_002277 [Cucumis sativus]